MTRLGSVLVFKKGLSKAEAKAALARLRDVLDPDAFVSWDLTASGKAVPCPPPVREFDDEDGGPVWYVP